MRAVRGWEGGEEVQVERKMRLNDRRLSVLLAADRDRLLYRKVVEGLSVTHAAREFRISRSLAHRRIRKIPMTVKKGIEAEAREAGSLRRSIVDQMLREAEARSAGGQTG